MGLRHSFVFVVSSCLCAAGCQQSSDTPSPASAGSPAAGGASSSGAGTASSASGATSVHGSVVVSLVGPSDENEGYSSVLGRFFDGPTPSPIPLKLAMEQGDCKL